MLLNSDFKDMLSALNEANADYLVVGAYALAAHGYPRATGDLDIWVKPSSENAVRVWHALAAFGAPMSNLTPNDLSCRGIVFQIGVVPCRIDVLTSISGVEFETAWQNRVTVQIENIEIRVIGRHDLLINKRASGRAKDQVDADTLDSPST